ncbi:thiamine-phosphate pyrophosphorylase [Secundilactobacillus oryzae JCM 18671]|uniref:Thiamine-phosphate synthase n=1 Tax=Secundilactobacillus oryzae JCM 18671 TaxID=1291743 RepID=A0A081BHF2_9LACO|nr:thiamine phosphate synthase [Secundilactobacillus oryzae]GAK47470.1 thiamine-phosphate pyrophosphorylase [Secundilactobacillus oryzae JCM 18671]
MKIPFNQSQLKAYFVCGTQDLPAGDLITTVESAIQAGITAFQLRDKGPKSTLDKTSRLAVAGELRQLCQEAGIPFIVDDDVDLALAVQADGIHVGQSDEQIQAVLERVAGKLFVGYSCSNLAEIEKANQIAGIAYYGCGPIFPTGSKADADPVIGLAGLTKLVEATDRPIVAIGGITEADLSDVSATGAAGSAVISMITHSDDVARTVKKMKEA